MKELRVSANLIDNFEKDSYRAINSMLRMNGFSFNHPIERSFDYRTGEYVYTQKDLVPICRYCNEIVEAHDYAIEDKILYAEKAHRECYETILLNNIEYDDD